VRTKGDAKADPMARRKEVKVEKSGEKKIRIQVREEKPSRWISADVIKHKGWQPSTLEVKIYGTF